MADKIILRAIVFILLFLLVFIGHSYVELSQEYQALQETNYRLETRLLNSIQENAQYRLEDEDRDLELQECKQMLSRCDSLWME